METIEIEVGRCACCGELWPACKCGRAVVHSTLDHMEPEPPLDLSPLDSEPAASPLVEWVQWKNKRGELSRYHVRVSSGGFLLCGRHVPHGITPAADSFALHDMRCRVCVSRLRELAS